MYYRYTYTKIHFIAETQKKTFEISSYGFIMLIRSRNSIFDYRFFLFFFFRSGTLKKPMKEKFKMADA